MERISWALAALLLMLPGAALACDNPLDACDREVAGAFPLVGSAPVTVFVPDGESEAVHRAGRALAQDIGRVGGSAEYRRGARRAACPAAYRCTVCGAELTMRMVNAREDKPPRHCREDMIPVWRP